MANRAGIDPAAAGQKIPLFAGSCELPLKKCRLPVGSEDLCVPPGTPCPPMAAVKCHRSNYACPGYSLNGFDYTSHCVPFGDPCRKHCPAGERICPGPAGADWCQPASRPCVNLSTISCPKNLHLCAGKNGQAYCINDVHGCRSSEVECEPGQLKCPGDGGSFQCVNRLMGMAARCPVTEVHCLRGQKKCKDSDGVMSCHGRGKPCPQGTTSFF